MGGYMRRLLVALAALGIPFAGSAATIPFDFTTLNGGVEGYLSGQATSATVAGVLAEGLLTNLTTPEPLWVRNGGTDHGLGVCSEGQSNCNTGGDVNEISGLTNPEAIRLTLPATASGWSSLWVSSLDSGGSNGNESGILEWSSTPGGFSDNPGVTSFHFSYNTFGGSAFEYDIFSAAVAGGFDKTAPYLLFLDNLGNCDSSGCNNDYLLWKGSYDTRTLHEGPEPGSLALLGAALGSLMLRRRQRA